MQNQPHFLLPIKSIYAHFLGFFEPFLHIQENLSPMPKNNRKFGHFKYIFSYMYNQHILPPKISN